MLPATTLASIQERLSRYGHREDRNDRDEYADDERGELFGFPVQRRNSRSYELDPKDILLGSDFENDVAQDMPNNEESRSSPIPPLPTQSAPWPASALATDIVKIDREIKTLTLSASSASGVDQKVQIGTRKVNSLRGTGKLFLKWLERCHYRKFLFVL